MPKPSVALCSAEADDQDERERDLAAPRPTGRSRGPRRSCAGRSRSRSAARAAAPGVSDSSHDRGARTRRPPPRPGRRAATRARALQPAVVVDEAHQPDGEADREQRARSRRTSAPVVRRRARVSTGSTPCDEHVPEAGRRRMPVASARQRRRAAPASVAADAAERQAEEDRERRRSRRGCRVCVVAHAIGVRVTLQRGAATTIDARWPPDTRSTSTSRRSTSSRSRSASTGPQATGLADARVARRRDARRLARVGRRDAEAARGRGARRARRAQGGDPHRGRAASAPSRSCASTGSSSGCSPTSWATRPPRRTCTPTSSATRSATTWSSGSTSKLGHPERCPHGWPVDTDFEQAENRELEPLSALEPGARATIVRLAEHDGDLLHWFYDEGLVPGRERRAARGRAGRGPVPRRASSGGEQAIGEKAAAGLFVRPR